MYCMYRRGQNEEYCFSHNEYLLSRSTHYPGVLTNPGTHYPGVLTNPQVLT